MPSETAAINILSNTKEFSELAARHGPFFFGVFLVLIAVTLIILNKNRYISGFFAICGVALIVWATLLYAGSRKAIHAYTMHLGGLKTNHTIVLKDSAPKLYRHNIMRDLEGGDCHVDLATISPKRLSGGDAFKVILREKAVFNDPDGAENMLSQDYVLELPFKGKANSVFYIKSKVVEEEEGGIIYYVVDETDQQQDDHTKLEFHMGLSELAYASDIGNPITSSSPILVAEESKSYIKSRHTLVSQSKDLESIVISVVYYRKASDQGRIERALDREQIPYVVRESSLSKPSNAVWIGVNVPADIAERIGLALLSESVDLKYFGYFTYPDTKTNILQIGYSKSNEGNKEIAENDIMNFINDFQKMKDEQLNYEEKIQEKNRLYQKEIWDLQKQQQEKL